MSYSAALLENAGGADERILDSTEIKALNEDEAISSAENWAARTLQEMGVDFAHLQITRDGIGIRSIPLEVHR
jgi:hypothetical protein